MSHWDFGQPGPIDSDDILMVEHLVRVAQTRMHPFLAPFVAVTCWGLRRVAVRWSDQ